ncbi:MAG: hypothetical protein HZC44_07650 [Geobacter sp.]|nr:hypothetical protein [Geobacter sp.]
MDPRKKTDKMSNPKFVNSYHYHLWTDALHARALARQARNRWDRGTYVRWCVVTAWTVLEIACQEATGVKDISYSFKKNLDSALTALNLPPLDWGSGTWQRVRTLQETRKGYMHRFLEENDLFVAASTADQAIEATREAIREIYLHCQRMVPAWVGDDEDRGWDHGDLYANCVLLRAGASESDERCARIYLLREGREELCEVLPPDIDPTPYVDEIEKSIVAPTNEIRVYRGLHIVLSRALRMRGN